MKFVLGALLTVFLFGAQGARALDIVSLDELTSAGCPPPVENDFKSVLDAQNAYKNAVAQHQSCRAAAAAEFLAEADGITNPVRWAGLTVSWMSAQGDFHQAAVQGLRLLTLLGEDADQDPAALEPLRLALVEAVYGACIKLGAERDSQWISWALGMGAQTDVNQRNLSLIAYLEDFPQAPQAHVIEKQSLALMDLFLRNELVIAQGYAKQGKTYAAVSRLQSLFANGQLFKAPTFRQVMETLLLLDDRLAEEIPRMTTVQVQNLLRVSYETTVDRAKTQKLIRANLCKQMAIWRKYDSAWAPSPELRTIEQRSCSR